MTDPQVALAPKTQQVMHKSEPAVPPADQVKQVPEAVTPPKVDFATDLFNMLSMDDHAESGSEAHSTDDNGWAGFQCMSKSFHVLMFVLAISFRLPGILFYYIYKYVLMHLEFDLCVCAGIEMVV